MEQNGSAVDDVVACSSNNFWNHPSPQFPLVGNYLPEEIRGDEFPESPSVTFQCKNVVNGNACLATKGRGRIFVPSSVLTELSQGVSKIQKRHEICAAPGLPPKPADTMSSANNRSDRLQEVQKHHDWYWKHLVQAMKPVGDYIPESGQFKIFTGTNFLIYPTWSDIFNFCQQEINADLIIRPTITGMVDGDGNIPATPSDIQETKNYLNTFQINHTATVNGTAPIVFILDDNIDVRHLDDEEKNKYKEPIGYQTAPSRNLLDISHGTKIFKFVAATSALNTEIRFLKVGGSDNIIDFSEVARAFGYIIDCTRNLDVVWINCSFTINPLNDPSALIEPDLFYDFHRTIHEMGFIMFGSSGNLGHTTSHHPWGECSNCISVGAEDNTTQKIAAFSSGCCNPLVNIIARGTNFAVSGNTHKFDGTSFSTAILSGTFSFMLPHIWTVDRYKTIHDVVKDFLVSTSDKKFGCDPAEHSHVPLQWNKFNFKTAIDNLLQSGKLPPEVMSNGSSTTSKVNLRNRRDLSLIRIGRPSELSFGQFPKKWFFRKKTLRSQAYETRTKNVEKVLWVCLQTRC